MLLAVVRMSPRPDSLQEAARLSGLAVPDVSRRLAGTLPRVLLSDASAERLAAMAAALEQAGFVVVTCDPAAVPGDDERVVARRLELAPGQPLMAFDAAGAAHRCPPQAVVMIQRGARTSRSSEMVSEKKRQLALGKAVLTGGLALSKTVETKTVRTTESSERFLLLHRVDGERDIMIYERRIDYRLLGGEMQASSSANLDRLAARLQSFLPGAPVDDRLARPGLVSGLPLSAADPTDLALFLVQLAHLRESAG